MLGPWPLALACCLSALASSAWAQDAPLSPSEAQQRADEALATPPPVAPAEAAAASTATKPLDLLDLYFQGGFLMYPITAMSFIAVVFSVERWLALRRGRIIPRGLVDGLGEMASAGAGFDPKQAYRLCQQYPSPTSRVIRDMLLKVGRPHSEVEHTLELASEREASKLYANVRPIALAISISPLMGLLGTVQGMIMAFYVTANSPVGANKAANLANGIYVALVTTFGGLAVAIPASVAAYYFEGRIVALFREIDALAQSLLPQLERYEGRLRVSPDQLAAADAPRSERRPAASAGPRIPGEPRVPGEPRRPRAESAE
jgi:biopolymer transport protein ExbB